jgi:hypothetical protein
MNGKNLSLFFVLALLGIGAYFFFTCTSGWCLLTDYQKAKLVTSFDTCVSLGFPVMESYPRKCSAGGKTYTENLSAGNPGTGMTTTGISHNDMITVTSLTKNAVVKSPLTIKGEARGNWYFEASFPVKLFDVNGEQLAINPAQAKGDWMTTNYVPFEVTLTFATPTTNTGTLVLLKDNPSGLPEHADQLSIPVRFK